MNRTSNEHSVWLMMERWWVIANQSRRYCPRRLGAFWRGAGSGEHGELTVHRNISRGVTARITVTKKSHENYRYKKITETYATVKRCSLISSAAKSPFYYCIKTSLRKCMGFIAMATTSVCQLMTVEEKRRWRALFTHLFYSHLPNTHTRHRRPTLMKCTTHIRVLSTINFPHFTRNDSPRARVSSEA